jgi:hypothetical protein
MMIPRPTKLGPGSAAEPRPSSLLPLKTGPSQTVAPDDGIGLTRPEVEALRAQH